MCLNISVIYCMFMSWGRRCQGWPLPSKIWLGCWVCLFQCFWLASRKLLLNFGNKVCHPSKASGPTAPSNYIFCLRPCVHWCEYKSLFVVGREFKGRSNLEFSSNAWHWRQHKERGRRSKSDPVRNLHRISLPVPSTRNTMEKQSDFQQIDNMGST